MSRTNRRQGLLRTLQLGGSGMAVAVLLAVLPVAANAADEFQLVDYRDKVVLVDFWASWCIPCRRSFPWMNEMQSKYADDGFVVIAVNLDNDLDDAHAFLQRYPAEFTVVYDKDRSLAHEYDVQVMPSSYLIGRDGKVVARHLGFKTSREDEYEATIVSILK